MSSPTSPSTIGSWGTTSSASASPPSRSSGDYTLLAQADRVERVLGSLGVERAVIVAHDLGDTVAAELLHRCHDGVLTFDVAGCVLTNGSIFIDLVQLSAGQEALLALPDEPLAESLGGELLRAGLAATFPPGAPEPGELDAIVALVEHNGGDLLLPRLIRYIEERRRNQPRWTSGLVECADADGSGVGRSRPDRRDADGRAPRSGCAGRRTTTSTSCAGPTAGTGRLSSGPPSSPP